MSIPLLQNLVGAPLAYTILASGVVDWPIMDKRKLGRRIASARHEAGLSVDDVAEAMAPLSPYTVRAWERGQNAPEHANLVKYAEVVGKPLSWFYAETDGTRVSVPSIPMPGLAAAIRTVLEAGGIAMPTPEETVPLDITTDPRYSPSEGFVLLPLLGRVTAGPGGIAEENVLSLHHVETTFIPHGQERDCFLLDVRGESMIDAGLRPGDRILVCSAVQVNDGDIAVVDVDGEAMVKRVYRRDHAVLLVSDNPDFAPREVETARIIGRVMNATRVF